MNEMRVLDIIERQFRAASLPLPAGFVRPLRQTREAVVWTRIARAIVSECDSDCRAAARTASMAGAATTSPRASHRAAKAIAVFSVAPAGLSSTSDT